MSNNNRRGHGPHIYDVKTLIEAGINPETGLPVKFDEASGQRRQSFNRLFRILDEQQAINRYTWYNLPNGLTGELIERILYYKGQGCFFWLPDTDDGTGTFYFLPYALSGDIDVFGRYKKVTPLPFNGTAKDKDDAWIQGLDFNVLNEYPDNVKLSEIPEYCVLLSDYSKQISQTNIPRSILQQPILDSMSEIFPLLRTNLIANSGVSGIRVSSPDESENVVTANKTFYDAAQEGQPYVPMIGSLEFQNLTEGRMDATQTYLQAFQSLDNLRMQMYGLQNGGILEKSSYVNKAGEMGNMQQNCGLQYQDGLYQRQRFCMWANMLYGLQMWCDSNEVTNNVDANMDGQIDSDSAMSESGMMNGGEEDEEV